MKITNYCGFPVKAVYFVRGTFYSVITIEPGVTSHLPGSDGDKSEMTCNEGPIEDESFTVGRGCCLSLTDKHNNSIGTLIWHHEDRSPIL